MLRVSLAVALPLLIVGALLTRRDYAIAHHARRRQAG